MRLLLTVADRAHALACLTGPPLALLAEPGTTRGLCAFLCDLHALLLPSLLYRLSAPSGVPIGKQMNMLSG